MPKVCLETPEVSDAISRPVVMQVVRQMAARLAIPSDISVRYLGGGVALAVPGSTLDDHGAGNRLPPDQRITIECVEEYVEDNTLTTAVMRPEHTAVFADSPLGIYITPVYQRVQVVVSVTLTATDRTTADTWISTMRRRSTQGVGEMLHLVDYHYPLPFPYLVILTAIHNLREAQGGYNQTIGAWLQQCLTTRATSIYDQAGGNATLVVREQQVGVLGWYDWTVPSKSEKDSDSGSYSSSFTYTFSYDRVESSVMEYPLMVHNQLLDARFYAATKPYEIEDQPIRGGLSTMILRNWTYEARASYAWRCRPGIPIPQFDDWLPDDNPQLLNLMRIMIARDPTNPHDILNLTELGVYSLHDETLDYMRQYPVGLVRAGESMFVVQLWDGRQLVNANQLIVGNNLSISTMYPLDVRRQYHLTLSILRDVRRLSKGAIQRLSKHGELAVTVMSLLDPYLVDARPVPANESSTTPIPRDTVTQQRLDALLQGSYPVTSTASGGVPPGGVSGGVVVGSGSGVPNTNNGSGGGTSDVTNPYPTTDDAYTLPATITTLGGVAIPNPALPTTPSIADRAIPSDPSGLYSNSVRPTSITGAAYVDINRPHHRLPVPRADGSIAVYDLQKALDLVGNRGYLAKAGTDYAWGLVGALTVHAHRST